MRIDPKAFAPTTALACAIILACESPPLRDPCPNGALEGDTTVSSQGELEEIARHTAIRGDLTISCPGCDDLTDLECVESVNGVLSIEGTDHLPSLVGLDSLAEAGSLVIDDNASLASLAALASLETSLGCLDIVYNGSLSDLTGLEGVASVENDAKIFHNTGLETVSGLGGLTAIGGSLEIHDNPDLADLDGLGSLKSVGGQLRIFDNPALSDCEVCELLDALEGMPTTLMVVSNLGDECTPVPSGCPGWH